MHDTDLLGRRRLRLGLVGGSARRRECNVNCAALTERGTIWDTWPELFDRMMAINVRAPFFLMQEAIELMQRAGIGGSIVNISSVAAYGSVPMLSPYWGPARSPSRRRSRRGTWSPGFATSRPHDRTPTVREGPRPETEPRP